MVNWIDCVASISCQENHQRILEMWTTFPVCSFSIKVHLEGLSKEQKQCVARRYRDGYMLNSTRRSSRREKETLRLMFAGFYLNICTDQNLGLEDMNVDKGLSHDIAIAESLSVSLPLYPSLSAICCTSHVHHIE